MELGTGQKNNLKVYMYFNQWCNRHLISGTLERTENHAGEKNLSGIRAGQNDSGRRKVRSIYISCHVFPVSDVYMHHNTKTYEKGKAVL